MKRLLTLTATLACLAAQAEIVDRIAVSVAGQVVTLSDIRRQIRLAAFIDGSHPDFSPASLRTTAALLVDQALVRREAELSRYPEPPVGEVDEMLTRFAASLGMDRKQMFSAASDYGFSEEDIREQAAWRLSLIRFIDYRFRPGVQLGEADVSSYYTGVFLPRFVKRAPESEPPPLDAVREQIVEILNTELATEASQLWLEQARKLTRIRYFEEAFQ